MQNPKKCEKSKNWYFLFSIISPILFNLHRHTIPHFKAIEKNILTFSLRFDSRIDQFCVIQQRVWELFYETPSICHSIVIKIAKKAPCVKRIPNLCLKLESIDRKGDWKRDLHIERTKRGRKLIYFTWSFNCHQR